MARVTSVEFAGGSSGLVTSDVEEGWLVDDVAFGRYRLIELIGEGGMGKVYKAHDTEMGRDVAVKVLPRELATNPGYEQRFRREASVAARLTEPHIIPIFEAGEIDGQLYLVMPVISGIDVQTVLRREGPMSPARAVQVIEQLAAALNAAHQHGLVHRDIKPSNALLTGDDFVYLIDFGIAHDAAATRLTSTGMTVGTMAYMAPERFTAGTADARADVYSLTCVLHECLTGATPYPGNSIEQQIAGHLSMDPPRPSAQRSDVGVAFDEVIAVGMAKSPDQRYQSARELAIAAREALGAVGAPARHPHSVQTLLADRSVPAGVDGALSPLPANFNVGAAQQHSHPVEPIAPPPWQPAAPPPWQPAPRGDRNRWRVLGFVAALVAVVALVGAGVYFATSNSKPAATTTTSTIASPPTTGTVGSSPTTAPHVTPMDRDAINQAFASYMNGLRDQNMPQFRAATCPRLRAGLLGFYLDGQHLVSSWTMLPYDVPGSSGTDNIVTVQATVAYRDASGTPAGNVAYSWNVVREDGTYYVCGWLNDPH